MTTVPPCGRGGLPWSRPPGDGLSGHELFPQFRATVDELGHETWTSRRAVTNYMGYQSSFVATVTASGWYGRFHGFGAWLVRGISVASPKKNEGAINPREHRQ